MSEAPPVPAAPTRNPFRRLYNWILSWAHHPMGTWMLALLSFIDSSIFPIPPLFLQVGLSLERPKKSFWYATVNTVASVLGSVVGYLIGMFLFESVGKWVIEKFGDPKEFENLAGYFSKNMFAFVLFYSFLPFPYKVITIGSGFLHADLPTLMIASTIGRGFRFFGLAAVCRWGGTRTKEFIDRYFNRVMIAIALFCVGILVLMKVILKK